jgi:glycerate dehydrogenase
LKKIVVLDNPGELVKSKLMLAALGEVTIYDRSRGTEEIAMRARDAEIVLLNKTRLTAETLAQLPKLKYIGVFATGYNTVDVAAARAQGIIVTNIPSYGSYAVSQHTFALLLHWTSKVGVYNARVQAGDWGRSQHFTMVNEPLIGLEGKIFGIYGFGQIGQQAARIALAFGMEVCYFNRSVRPLSQDLQQAVEAGQLRRIETAEELFRISDVLSLHCPLNEETQDLINAQTLTRMKPSAILINTARGGLIVEEDLAAALRQGTIAAALLDVLRQEPPKTEHVLYGLENCVITPHIAWLTPEARARLVSIAIENVQAYVEGHPQNIVQ